jgi:hypothetical protein
MAQSAGSVRATWFTSLPCFQHVRWNPDRSELRRFALWMLGGFAVLGLIAVWRTGTVGVGPSILWGLGLALAIGAMVPGLGRVAYLAVYLTSGVIGYVVSRIVLALIFYLVFLPIGFALRARGRDILQRRRPAQASMWLPHHQRQDPGSYYRQF